MPGGDGSMFDTVKNHEERILVLEEADKKHEERLRVVESNYTNLENTILKGNQSTQDFFRDLSNKQWDLINERDKAKESERQREHERSIGKQQITKSNWDNGWKVFGQLAGAGGIIYVVIEFLITK